MNLSAKLQRYLINLEDGQNSFKKHFQGDVLMIDSIMESGNLL